VEWLSAMAEAYGKRAECFVEQFNNYGINEISEAIKVIYISSSAFYYYLIYIILIFLIGHFKHLIALTVKNCRTMAIKRRERISRTQWD